MCYSSYHYYYCYCCCCCCCCCCQTVDSNSKLQSKWRLQLQSKLKSKLPSKPSQICSIVFSFLHLSILSSFTTSFCSNSHFISSFHIFLLRPVISLFLFAVINFNIETNRSFPLSWFFWWCGIDTLCPHLHLCMFPSYQKFWQRDTTHFGFCFSSVSNRIIACPLSPSPSTVALLLSLLLLS